MSPQIWKIGKEDVSEIRKKDNNNNITCYVQAVFVYFQISVYYFYKHVFINWYIFLAVKIEYLVLRWNTSQFSH